MLIRLPLVLFAVGVYVGYCNHFNIGAFMEKVLSGLSSLIPVQLFVLLGWHFAPQDSRSEVKLSSTHECSYTLDC